MRVTVRHDAIADTVARLALTVRQFEDALDALDAEVTLLRSSWSGEAQAAYDRAHHDWDTAIRGMKAALAEANRRLITANAISMETASTATALWR
jgi:WXG100 family type VII secretion target